MWKLWKKFGLLAMAAAIVWCAGILRDKCDLGNNLIRLHVVANSDSEEDQAVKLQVRDAVIHTLQEDISGFSDADSAKAYLRERLPDLETVANDTLQKAGASMTASVSLCREQFDVRHYDSFSLPAGVYESLRVTIGEGKGKNWWCVVFPGLCYSAVGETFEEVAAGAGFSDDLITSIEGKNHIEIRFFLLDFLGQLENMLFDGGI